MSKKITSIVLILLFIAAPAIAGRRDRGGDLPHGKWWNNTDVIQKLNLSDKETKTLDDMYINHRRTVIKLRSKIEEEQFELSNLIDSRTIDDKAVFNQAEKLDQARSKLSQERFRFFLNVRKLLGYDRYQQLKSMFQNMQTRRKYGHVGRRMKKSAYVAHPPYDASTEGPEKPIDTDSSNEHL